MWPHSWATGVFDQIMEVHALVIGPLAYPTQDYTVYIPNVPFLPLYPSYPLTRILLRPPPPASTRLIQHKAPISDLPSSSNPSTPDHPAILCTPNPVQSYTSAQPLASPTSL